MSTSLTSVGGSSVRSRKGGGLRSMSLYSLLVLVTILSIVPLWWMVSTSLKTKPEIYVYPPTLWPDTPQWQNYLDAWTADGMRFTLWTYNTLLITVVVLVGVMLTSSLCAYGFARIRFPGRNFWFVADVGLGHAAQSGHADSTLHHLLSDRLAGHLLALDRAGLVWRRRDQHLSDSASFSSASH